MLSTRGRKIAAGAAGGIAFFWLFLTVAGAHVATMSYPSEVRAETEFAGHPAVPVTLETVDGVALSGWHVVADEERAVLLLHGISSNRRQMNRRAELFARLGYSSLLYDARGHGESGKARVTMGWNERRDLAAAYQYLRDCDYTCIGVDGVSMGAATAAMACGDLDFDFVILESCYDTLDHAWRNRLALVRVPHVITYPLRWLFERRIGARAKEIEPLRFLEQCTAPTLILGGDSELEIKVSETQSLYDRCAAEQKRIHFFRGAGHDNFASRYSEEFQRVVTGFLEETAPCGAEQ